MGGKGRRYEGIQMVRADKKNKEKKSKRMNLDKVPTARIERAPPTPTRDRVESSPRLAEKPIPQVTEQPEHPTMAVQKGTRVGEYVASRCVGTGNFAMVWKAHSPETGEIVVLKNVDRTKLSDKRLDLEVAVMQKLDHPNCVKIIRVLKKTPTNLIMACEYCNRGDLFAYINSHEVRSLPGVARRSAPMDLT
jgi:serine/threonine protein kinase